MMNSPFEVCKSVDTIYDFNMTTPIKCYDDKSKDSIYIEPYQETAIDHDGVKFIGLSDDSICSSSQNLEEINDDKENLDIPDGGWGWVVVFSSFLISMIADGISFSFGLLYVEFLDYFGASKSKTAWIGSLFIAVPLLSGPVMSVLVDKYGCRKMTVLGGIISTIGFILASISDSIQLMLVTFGVIAGLGLGLVYVTAVVSIAYWFDKRRTLAVSLGACGTGVGTFVYAPMSQYFIDNYGWRGTILLLSGTLLNLCVCGCVMKDPEWWIIEQKKQAEANRSKRTSSTVSISARSGGGESVFPGVEELKSLMKSGETPEYILTQLATSIMQAESLENATEINREPTKKVHSVVNLPTFLKQSEKVPVEVIELLIANKRVYNVILENYPSLLNFRSSSEHNISIGSREDAHNKQVTMSMKLTPTKRERSDDKDSVHEVLLPTIFEKAEHREKPSPATKQNSLNKQSSKESTSRQDWLKRQFSVNHHYLRDIKVHKNNMMHRSAMMNISKYRLKTSSCPNIYRNSMIYLDKVEKRWYTSFLDYLIRLFDFSMFLEFHFLLMSLATICLFVWFIVPYFYLAEHLSGFNYTEEEAALLLSVIGIANTIGMVFLGWAGDQPWMHVTKSYAACLFLCGLTVALYPILTPYYCLLVVNSALFGSFFASAFSFTPGILVELIPLERFTTAYGLILLCQGVGHLIGPPLSGFIYDVTQSWELSFYLAGLWICIAGLLISVIPMTNNFRIYGDAPLEKDAECQLSQPDSVSVA